MTEKKHHHHKEESQPEKVNEIKAEVVETPESGAPTRAEFEALQQKLTETEAQASEFKDGWLRTQAEFQNFRKRVERDRDADKATMKGDIIKKVLPALDDLERALQNRPTDNAWASGIELIARKLQNILESEGVKRIEAEGVMFDPTFHEAISHEPSDEVESGHVIAVVQNGYMFGERVIRPALVRVAQ